MTTTTATLNRNQAEIHQKAEGLLRSEIGSGGTILLVRHGEVENREQILYGRLPGIHLSQSGRAQATQLGNFLSDLPLARLYSSPLLRARQTAEAIRIYHPYLRRQNSKQLSDVYTSYQGLPLSEIIGFNFYEPRASPQDETLVDICERMLKFSRTVLNRYPGRIILAVTHGDPITTLYNYYLGRALILKNIRPPNFSPAHASITRFDFPPEGFTDDRRRVQVSYQPA